MSFTILILDCWLLLFNLLKNKRSEKGGSAESHISPPTRICLSALMNSHVPDLSHSCMTFHPPSQPKNNAAVNSSCDLLHHPTFFSTGLFLSAYKEASFFHIKRKKKKTFLYSTSPNSSCSISKVPWDDCVSFSLILSSFLFKSFQLATKIVFVMVTNAIHVLASSG